MRLPNNASPASAFGGQSTGEPVQSLPQVQCVNGKIIGDSKYPNLDIWMNNNYNYNYNPYLLWVGKMFCSQAEWSENHILSSSKSIKSFGHFEGWVFFPAILEHRFKGHLTSTVGTQNFLQIYGQIHWCLRYKVHGFHCLFTAAKLRRSTSFFADSHITTVGAKIRPR